MYVYVYIYICIGNAAGEVKVHTISNMYIHVGKTRLPAASLSCVLGDPIAVNLWLCKKKFQAVAIGLGIWQSSGAWFRGDTF